jgi:uncharacterized protein YndB with AHSA1/START domain
MSTCRHQALIESDLERVWRLVGDPRRHPEWWPRVMEVKGQSFAEGDIYRQVTTMPIGRHETTLVVERLDDLREIRTRCLDTGMYANWRFTEARNETFVDVEMGMEPKALRHRVFDAAAGRRYFRRWLEQSIDELRAAAEREG